MRLLSEKYLALAGEARTTHNTSILQSLVKWRAGCHNGMCFESPEEKEQFGGSCLVGRAFIAGLWRSVEPAERRVGHPRRRRGRRGT